MALDSLPDSAIDMESVRLMHHSAGCSYHKHLRPHVSCTPLLEFVVCSFDVPVCHGCLIKALRGVKHLGRNPHFKHGQEGMD